MTAITHGAGGSSAKRAAYSRPTAWGIGMGISDRSARTGRWAQLFTVLHAEWVWRGGRE